MQVSINIEDDLYTKLQKAGVDIQTTFKEYLLSLLGKSDDDIKPICFEEASKRVSEAVKRYDTKSGEYIDEEEYQKEMERFYQEAVK